MGLDIRISRAKPIYCPHCGELVTYRAVDTVDGGGSSWYEFLESIGYYKPYVKGEPYSQPMYGEDMALNDKQVDELFKFVNQSDLDDLWQMTQTSRLIESARIDGDKIVINADW
nr:MAG TPA: Nin one binding (NOB1) Zn-ribbon like [Caudoviricetes sp.]